MTWSPTTVNSAKREMTDDNIPDAKPSLYSSSSSAKPSSPASDVKSAKGVSTSSVNEASSVPVALCLGATSKNNGTPIELVDCASPAANIILGSHLHVTFSGRCLHVVNGTTAAVGNGSPVTLWDCNTNALEQLWTWKIGADGVQMQWKGTLGSRNSGLCLDVKDGNFSLGAELQLWSCREGQNQVFGWEKLLGIEYPNTPSVKVDDLSIKLTY